MSDYNLHKLVDSIEQQLKEKYQVDSLKIFVSTSKDQSINLDFKHFEIKDRREIVREIMTETLYKLKENSYEYEFGVSYPNPVMTSSQPIDFSRPNESTIEGYSLIRAK